MSIEDRDRSIINQLKDIEKNGAIRKIIKKLKSMLRTITGQLVHFQLMLRVKKSLQ